MPEEPCPECPACGKMMKKAENGLCKCPKCGAVFIPPGCTGVFIPMSIIGIR